MLVLDVSKGGILKRIFLIVLSIFLLSFVACKSAPKNQDSKGGANSLTDSKTNTAKDNTSKSDYNVMSVNTAAAKEAAEARDAAIAAGADKLGAPYNVAEAKYGAAMSKAEKSDARNELSDAKTRYNALENYALALAAKERIDKENLSSFSQDDYDAGNALMSGLGTMFADANSSSRELLTRSTDALTSYTKVLNLAYKKRAAEARTAAIAAKRRADSVMAGAALKSDYNIYVTQMKAGDSSYSRQNSAAAYDYYMTATEGFNDLYTRTNELRTQALAAMEAARKSVQESHQYAVEADENTPILDDNQEGIERPDAVLVEAETYEDPAKAVENLPDTIEGM